MSQHLINDIQISNTERLFLKILKMFSPAFYDALSVLEKSKPVRNLT